MLKHLLLIFLFSGSLDSFSQDTVNHRTLFTGRAVSKGALSQGTPDTLRAIVLVTLSPNGIAHARMGFVVICEGKEVVYLDCRKRALKMPQAGWGWRVVNPNKEKQ